MAAAAASAPGAPGVEQLVIETVVTGVPAHVRRDGEVRYRLIVAEDALQIVPGADARPSDVEFLSDYATAVMLACGDLNAQEALARGRLAVRGKIGVLGARAGVLGALDDVFAGVREGTTYVPEQYVPEQHDG